MGFAWPFALLALSAVAIPVIIHLLQLGQHRVITVATTRFLADNSQRRWRKVALDNPLVLLVRCLLLIAAAVFLAEPFTLTSPSQTSHAAGWVTVSPQVSLQQAQQLGAAADGEWRWLSPGFPPVDQQSAPTPGNDAWSLIAQADATLPPGDRLTVILPAFAGGLGVKRPPLRHDIAWLVAAPGAPRAHPASIDAMVVYDAHRTADAKWLGTVFDAWSDAGISMQRRLVPRSGLLELADWTVWLSDTAVPQVARPVTVLTDRRQASDIAVPRADSERAGWLLAEWWQGTQRRINIGAGLQAGGPVTGEPEFAELLLNTFAQESVSRPPANYPVSAFQLAPGKAGGSRQPPPVRQSHVALFAVLLALLWCAERLMSAWIAARPEHD